MRTAAPMVSLAAATAFAAPTLAAPPVGCDEGLSVVASDSDLGDRVAGAAPPVRRELRGFLETARKLDIAGYGDACEAVVEAVRDFVNQRVTARGIDGDEVAGDPGRSDASGTANGRGSQDRGGGEDKDAANDDTVGEDDAGTADAADPAPERGLPTVADRGDAAADRAAADAGGEATGGVPGWRTYDYSAGAERAEPFEALADSFSSDRIVGAEIRTMGGDELGSVEGFLMSKGGISDLIIGYGGVLGISEREVAAPIDRVFFDREDDVFYTRLTRAELDLKPDWDQQGRDDPGFWIKDE